MFGKGADGRGHYRPLYRRLVELPPEERTRRQHAAEQFFLHQGITFAVDTHEDAPDRHEDFLRIVRPMRRKRSADVDAASGAQAQHQQEQQQQQ